MIDHSLIETAKREDPDDPPSNDDIRKEKIKGIGTGIDNIPKMIMVYFSPWSADAPALDLPQPRTLVHLP